ncbi:MAG TPA: C4-type zinc ribbon domain-containing protein [Candidatus Paceibacterota bacterium]|nr:C4-type zinc ribbon domain-containing protein [Verrucomicrobiota bacterium]HRY47578.1 C4-type zinc ribbon domain-containing protein [Candidatus Paceibacterota bacterium]HRZ99219.1 C4-type zinc ribbon domain-containing protein [Candidatus Paceibacterota bacterium]
MKNTIAPLFELQTLEAKSPNPEEDSEIQRLRKKVLPQILGHYDRLRARGKRGVALVRNGVCAECHMRLASGTYATLLRAEDIMICDNCGRYLFLDPATATAETAEESTKTKPPKTTRARRKKADPTPAA